jgi:hypothetical protein
MFHNGGYANQIEPKVNIDKQSGIVLRFFPRVIPYHTQIHLSIPHVAAVDNVLDDVAFFVLVIHRAQRRRLLLAAYVP